MKPIVERLGYMSLGVKNLEEAVTLYSRIGRLEETERRGRTAFMTAGVDHHWLRLEEGEADGVNRVAYEVDGPEALEAARDVLRQWNIDYDERKDPLNERVAHRLRFADPGGMPIELFYGMTQRPNEWSGQGIRIKKLLHAGWATPNIEEVARFYQEGLGFKLSDQIEDQALFLRAGDRYHHSLVLLGMNVDKARFGHFCFLVDTLDDVMRIRTNALRHGGKISMDLMRHGPSGSAAVYFRDAARMLDFEYCFDHAQIDDATHRPRILQNTPEAGNVWERQLTDPITFN